MQVVLDLHGIDEFWRHVALGIGLVDARAQEQGENVSIDVLLAAHARHDVQGFESGEHIPALASVDQDDHRGHGPAFGEGSVRALHWTYGRSGGSKPALTPIAHRTFIFATTMGDRTVYGTFTLKRDGDRASVRIVRGSTLVADALFKVP